MVKALVVIDMQNDFISGALGTPEAENIVPNVANKIKSLNENDILIFTRDTHYDNYLDTLEGTKLPVAHCIVNTWGWQIHKDILDAAEDFSYMTIDKPTFGSIDLMDHVMDIFDPEDVEIEICGLCTDICVASNALMLRAAFPNAPITIDSTCCAGVTPATHEAALTTMKMCQIDVL